MMVNFDPRRTIFSKSSRFLIVVATLLPLFWVSRICQYSSRTLETCRRELFYYDCIMTEATSTLRDNIMNVQEAQI